MDGHEQEIGASPYVATGQAPSKKTHGRRTALAGKSRGVSDESATESDEDTAADAETNSKPGRGSGGR